MIRERREKKEIVVFYFLFNLEAIHQMSKKKTYDECIRPIGKCLNVY